MGNLITSRVILFAIFVFHVFVGYAGPAVLNKHIKAWLYDALFAVEILAVTAYIIYDNIVCPIPHDGWFLAIVGYIVVYAVIILTWVVFSSLIIDPKKVYKLADVKHRAHIIKEGIFFKGVMGTIREGWREFEVILPDEEAFANVLDDKPIYVKLEYIRKDLIFVTRFKENPERKGLWME